MTSTDFIMHPDKDNTHKLETLDSKKSTDYFTASEMYVKQVLARIRQSAEGEHNDDTYLF
jgi:hypothetical protein